METFLKVASAALSNVDRGLCSGASRGSKGGNNWFRETTEVGHSDFFLTHQKIGVGQVLVDVATAAAFLSEWPSVLQLTPSRDCEWEG